MNLFDIGTTSDDSPDHILANRQAWDSMARQGVPLCQPATDDQFCDPLRQVDPLGWLGPTIDGWKVLCLAAGGGRHSALYAAAGADVTVVDLSPVMLDLDRQVARERGFSIRIVECSMDSMPMLRTEEFDLVVHPVSTCYVPDVAPVFKEVARVVRAGGLYVSQHKQPASLQTSCTRSASGHYILEHPYYRDTPMPHPSERSSVASRLRERGAIEYLHRWEQLVGGICRAGFSIVDLVEPLHSDRNAVVNSFSDRANYVAPYLRVKAQKNTGSPAKNSAQCSSLWIPGF